VYSSEVDQRDTHGAITLTRESSTGWGQFQEDYGIDLTKDRMALQRLRESRKRRRSSFQTP
jgi:hypothetical protein